MTILDDIVAHKKAEIARLKSERPLGELRREAERSARKPRGLKAALLRSAGPVAVIAELKRRSPSKGVLRDPFDPASLGRAFEQAGAAALSVLTDERFFGGSLATLATLRDAVKIPLLRKDFILEECQLYESAAAGADAVLLIAELLEPAELIRLKNRAEALGLDALVEVHSEADVRKIAPLRNALIGINNRDLKTFQVDLDVTARLVKLLEPGHLVVSESGIRDPRDLRTLGALGVRAALVGESLMTEKDPGAALRRLLHG